MGPEGTFTHQAVRTWAAGLPGETLRALPQGTVGEVHDAVSSGAADVGVVAIESSVEGHVVPSLDVLLGSADVVAVDEVVLDISFDAFVRPGHGVLTEATAHPHGLAQCRRFVVERGLVEVPAASNGAACRDVQGHQVAFGPRLCGELYGLETLAESVEDHPGARTRFLVLDRRARAVERFARRRDASDDGATAWRTTVAVTPVVTGPGVLARITDAFGARAVNMSSLVTRPLKAREGQYVFVVTLDAAPWEVRELFGDLLAAGDALKVLGAYPAAPGEGGLDGQLADHAPAGSVRHEDADAVVDRGLLW
nr:prephenate dehydratase domain-containing protein [Isoptericola halotolerans]